MRQREVVILTHMLGRYMDDFGNVVRYLQEDGVKVIVYASRPREGDELSSDSASRFDAYASALGADVELHELPYVRGLKMMPLDLVRLTLIGFRLARKHPDAMFQMWSVYIMIACGVPLRLFNRRSLYMVTGLGPVLGSKGKQFRVFRTIIEIAYRFLMTGKNSRCLNHNQEDKWYLAQKLHADPDKFFVTPGCGVDPAYFPWNEEVADNPVPVALVPARLIADKGVLEAIEASNILRDRNIAHEMWFTGALEPYPWIAVTRDDIDRAERENPAIKFIGFQEAMPPLYAKVDVVCYPTRYPEGTPTALIEAAASGRPAVTCDTVGAREIVIDEVTGLIGPQRDAIALADGLERLLTDGDLRERFRREAYTHFLDSYTKDKALEATLEAFESVGFVFEAPKKAPEFRLSLTS